MSKARGQVLTHGSRTRWICQPGIRAPDPGFAAPVWGPLEWTGRVDDDGHREEGSGYKIGWQTDCEEDNREASDGEEVSGKTSRNQEKFSSHCRAEVW